MNWVTPAVLNDLTEGIHNLRSPKSPLPSQTHFQLIQVNHIMSDLDDLGACVPGCLGDLDDLRVQGNLDDLSNLDVLDDLGTQTLSSTWSAPPPRPETHFQVTQAGHLRQPRHQEHKGCPGHQDHPGHLDHQGFTGLPGHPDDQDIIVDLYDLRVVGDLDDLGNLSNLSTHTLRSPW